MFRFSRIWISRFLISLALLVAAAARRRWRRSAQDRRQNAPGEFDFYVLSLSWSPSFCEAAAERGNSGRSQQSSAAAALLLRGPRPVAAI